MRSIILLSLIASYVVMCGSEAMAQPALTEQDALAKLQALGSYPNCGAIIPLGTYSFAAIGESPDGTMSLKWFSETRFPN